MKKALLSLAATLLLAAGASGCNDSGPLGPLTEPTEEEAPDPDADKLPEGVSGRDLLNGCTAPVEVRSFDEEIFVYDDGMPHDASVETVLQTREFIGEWTLYERLDDYEDEEGYDVELNPSDPVVGQYHRAVAINGLTVMVDPNTGEMAFALGNRKDDIINSDEEGNETWVNIPDLWCNSAEYTHGAHGVSVAVSKLDYSQTIPPGLYPHMAQDQWYVFTSGVGGEEDVLTVAGYERNGGEIHNGDDSWTPSDWVYYDLTGMADSEIPDYSGQWYSADVLNRVLGSMHLDMSKVSDAIIESSTEITEEGDVVVYYPASAFSE
ncbi:hypothetical protein HOG48_02870 [Candidatus Peregrinibacteria bacterium]|nr:hypothetical protein [Candidatus Peregrinibacteria bacterium]